MGTGINFPPPPPLQFVQTGNSAADANNQRIAYQWADWFYRLQALAQAIGWTINVTAPPEFNLTGVPVGAGGTIGLNWSPQQAHMVLAGPTHSAVPGTSGVPFGIPANFGDQAAFQPTSPSFRLLIASDYPTMVGDSGSGGVQGAVPAPAAGDAAAMKFLFADGSWRNLTTAAPWPFVKESVASTETCTIPTGYQLILVEEFDVDGTLNANGELFVLS